MRVKNIADTHNVRHIYLNILDDYNPGQTSTIIWKFFISIFDWLLNCKSKIIKKTSKEHKSNPIVNLVSLIDLHKI